MWAGRSSLSQPCPPAITSGTAARSATGRFAYACNRNGKFLRGSIVPTNREKTFRQLIFLAEARHFIRGKRLKARINARLRQIDPVDRDVQPLSDILRGTARNRDHPSRPPTRESGQCAQIQAAGTSQSFRIVNETQIIDRHDKRARHHQRRDECQFMDKIQAA